MQFGVDSFNAYKIRTSCILPEDFAELLQRVSIGGAAASACDVFVPAL
jgi:hypothetical protein